MVRISQDSDRAAPESFPCGGQLFVAPGIWLI
jgi:hypothetical protein